MNTMKNYIYHMELMTSYLRNNIDSIQKIVDLVQSNQNFFSEQNTVNIWGKNALEVAYEKLNRLIWEYNHE